MLIYGFSRELTAYKAHKRVWKSESKRRDIQHPLLGNVHWICQDVWTGNYRVNTLEMVQLLVQVYGADIEAADKEGYTALHIASRNGRLDVVQFLVETKESNVDAVTSYGSTEFR
jgi:ankyrin repeat protein